VNIHVSEKTAASIFKAEDGLSMFFLKLAKPSQLKTCDLHDKVSLLKLIQDLPYLHATIKQSQVKL
jgi:hypothetical protein